MSIQKKMLKPFLFTFLAMVMLCSPALAQVFNPTSFTLENGLQVVVVENHRAPVINHMIVYRVGAKDEPIGKSGIAHFMEHLMFKGTPKIPAGEFSQIVRSIGGQDNAFTTQDYTAYFQSVAREHLPLVMEMEADRMTNLALTDEIVAVERDVIIKERGQRTDNDPIGAFWEDINNLIFVNHPYAIPVIGWRHEIENLSKTDIETFYQKWYAPNNAIVLISGDINVKEAKNLVREYYAPIEIKTLPNRVDTTIPSLTGQRRLIKQSPRIQQPLWSRHYRAPQSTVDTIKDSDALLFFADIFGGGATGILYQKLVVEQKIATNAFISYSAQSIGPARFSFIITPAEGINVEGLDLAVNAVLDEFFKNGISEQKISETAESLKIQSIFARDTLTGAGRILGGALASGLDIKTVEDWPKRVDAIQATDVMTAARKLLTDPHNLPVSGIMIPEGGAQ